MSGDTMMFLIMIGLFLLIAGTMLAANWYTNKYPNKITFYQIVFTVVLLVFGGFFLFIKSLGSSEKNNIIRSVSLQNTVVEIYNQTRKPYFKEMKFDDGKTLPMPEEMNGILQIGDSIYKNKDEDFYTIVNPTTKTRTKFAVKIHERILGKPQ